MKDDPLRIDIESELRALRTKPGPLDVDRIASAEVLTDVVGRGSTERAFTTLMALLDLHGGDPDGDVRAYFETCGHDLAGDTLNQRLEAYEARHFVDGRTGLRRSNRGAAQLSYILRDQLPYERPWGHIAVTEASGLVRVKVWVEVFHGAKWRRPQVYINGNLQQREFELHDSHNDLFATAEEWFAHIPLLPAAQDEALFVVTVHWAMPVWSVWKVGTSLATPGLYSVLTSERHPGAEVAIHPTTIS
ncbi:hypothetical protein [Microbacterium sp. Leaf179]|uniref:hypothetical protein n=1 Tax=Microbacterium sp. Leaf179 TaxID=1736288 RepID=UPI0006FF9337|nr:hypothetical protein [Microbacterium sp. Leaf179]KQR86704.1 hypothetical protein ASF96_10275 [Microbacterium sp. Leaf179]